MFSDLIPAKTNKLLSRVKFNKQNYSLLNHELLMGSIWEYYLYLIDNNLIHM